MAMMILEKWLTVNITPLMISNRKENFLNSNSFSILHLNVHSIGEIQVTLNLTKFHFDILCFLESMIIDGIGPKTNIMHDGYQEPIGMHTKVTKGGVLIYVKMELTLCHAMT